MYMQFQDFDFNIYPYTKMLKCYGQCATSKSYSDFNNPIQYTCIFNVDIVMNTNMFALYEIV